MKPRRDVVVIGGGLLGCSLALSLAKEGVDVLLLERDQINQHASGRNAGSLHYQLEYRMVEHGVEAARRAAEAIPLHLEAAQLWRQIGERLGAAAGVSAHGGLMLADDPESARLLEAKADLERSWGLDVSVLTRDETLARAPYLSGSVVAASYCPIEGKANARTAALAIGREAVATGATVHTRTEVTSIRRDGARWRLEVQDRDSNRTHLVEADALVLAAGVWCNDLAAMFGASVPVEPLALSMMVTARTAPFLPHLVQHAGARLSLKQTAEGNVLIGGGWPARMTRTAAGTVDLAAAGRVLPESMSGNARAAVRAVPAVGELPVVRTWVGTTTVAPDQLPVVGAIPGAPGAFVATGGSVFTLGPAFAVLLAELIQGRTPHLDLTPYAPTRFERTPPAAVAVGAAPHVQ